MTRPRRLRRALTFLTAALLAGAGMFVMSSPALADTPTGVSVSVTAGDPVCSGPDAATVTVIATIDPSTPGYYPAGTPLEIYVNRALHDGTPELQLESYGGFTGSDGTYTVAVPLALDTPTVLSFGVIVNGQSHYYGDPEYTFPDACRSTPERGLTTKAWNVAASTDTDGETTVSFNYALLEGKTHGYVFPDLFSGRTTDGTSPLVYSDSVPVTEPGDHLYSHTLTLTPGDYTLRIQGEVACGGDCFGQLPIADDYHFTVPTSTPTPSPTDSPTLAPSGPAATTPSASLSTNTAAPNGQITVTASGLAPNEPVELWLHSTSVKLWSGAANADGTLTQAVTIPAGIEVGKHQIELRGATNGSLWLDLTVTDTLAATGFDPAASVGLGIGGGMLLLGGAGILTATSIRRRRAA